MRKDWTGQKYNYLTFIRPADNMELLHGLDPTRKHHKVIWELECDCGRTTHAIGSDVARGKTKTCNYKDCPLHLALHHKVAKMGGRSGSKDWTGKKRGMLTFIRETDQMYGDKIVWEAQCECGTITYKAPSSVGGETISCGCRKREMQAGMSQVARRHDPRMSTARARWSTYRHRDKTMCDFDTFYRLSQLPCDYCKRLPHRVARLPSKKVSSYQLQEGNFTYNGVDRVDNTKGHTADNLVPCCWDCNHMKGRRTRQEFLEHIARINLHATEEHDYVW